MGMNFVKRLGTLAIVLLIMMMQTVPCVTAETAEPQGKTVRVACGMNDALYLDDAGDPAGICLPYLRQLAWNKNWTLEYVEGSYNESIQNLYDGKIDLMFPVGKDDDIEGKLAFADFIGGYQQIGLFAKDDGDIYYDDYDGFDNTRVGLSLGANSNILDAFAAQHGFSYTPVPLNSIQDKVDALNNSDVDMIAFSTLNTVKGGKLVAVLDQVPFYFCTSADNQELMQEVNSSMSETMINTPDLVSDMYGDVLKGNNAVSLTKEENEKIKNTDKVVFGVYSDCLPLAGIDSEGNCVGIYVDLLKLIAEQSGLNIEIKPIEDGNRLYSYLDDGTVDFVIGVQELRFFQENADNHLASNGITEYTTAAVTKPDYQFEDDDSPVIALTSSRNYLENYIMSNFPSAKIRYYDTRKECMNAVKTGRADATFINTWEYNYESKNPRYQDLIEWESTRITSVVGLGGTRQSDLEILSILEKTISQVTQSQEKISDIISANLNIPYNSYSMEDRLYEFRTGFFVFGGLLLVIIAGFSIYMGVKRRYINDLITANNAKSDFLSRMSHELRTPLNAISGYAAITSESAQNDNVKKEELLKNMKSIQKAAEYLLGIIKDILDVQKMETGNMALEISEINPTEYMQNVVNMIQPMADENGVHFTYDAKSDTENVYIMDSIRVQQVLFNILYNAFKFTPEGGSVTMTSELTEQDESSAIVRFVVADTGIGMSPEFMKTKLFHKFAQENQDITSPYTGCGNGLAICKELVDLMGGDISCVSEQGKGTTFTIDIRAEYHKTEKRGRRRNAAVAYDLSGVRVLMCEDNPMNQDMERHLLERMKCEVDIADDGEIGLKKFRSSVEGYYSVILMDIRMPNMDGLKATEAIRASDRADAKTVPILAVSANAFEEDIKKSLEAGMNEHLAKPVSAIVLYEKIREYCKL